MCRGNFQLSSAFILVALFAVGCAGVNYVGNSFDPTTTVDVYFSKEEIETDYTVMGHALGTGTWVSNDKIQKKLQQDEFRPLALLDRFNLEKKQFFESI